MLEILPIKAFEDNYIWLLKYQNQAVVVDPGDAVPVIEVLQAQDLTLAAILITHHHSDHIGGVDALLDYKSVPIYAPSYRDYPFTHQAVKDQDVIHINAINTSLKVLWLPGHTHDHIAYLHHDHLFCGDIIFAAGCGRIFDGSLAQQYHSLNIIKTLPPNTKLYCAHEYTAHNIAFALTVEPNNQALIERQATVKQQRSKGQATIPTTLQQELETNPFLRCNLGTMRLEKGSDNTEDFFSFLQNKRIKKSLLIN